MILLFFWEKYHKTERKILFCGQSDLDNKAPSRWHWNTIDEVIHASKINIPEFFGTFLCYDNNLRNYMEKYLHFILQNINNWKIKCQYRNGLPDEIVYAIIFGLEKIRPDNDIFTLITDKRFCDVFNKNV